MEDLEASATLEFHGARYVVTVQVQQQQLDVQVEAADAHAPPSSVWTARFTASDVEQLTRQTGNSKRFPVFVQMLLTALHRRSDAVFVDLLTAADLDLYRQRKLQPGAVSDGLTSATAATKNGKRYLILTYAVEFDRVHYPLPLTQELSPSPEVLQRTIRRLRQALAEQTNSAASESNGRLAEENAALREENRCLKNTLKQYCDDVSGNGNAGMNATGELQRELQASIEENKELIALYQQFREDSAVETARLRTEIKQLRLANQQNDRSELARQDQERLETRLKIKDSNAAVQETLAQMVQMKAQLEETQLKNRELLRQLAIARAQAGQQGTRQRPALNANRGSDLSSRFTRGRSPSTRPVRSPAGALRQQQSSSAVFPAPFQSTSSHYGPSDDEDAGGRTPRSARRGRPTAQPAFRRFDPTAYQQEKERKLREARARSNSRTRPPRSNGGYSSDSSVGGYSSADSRGSKASSRSTRSRSSRLSSERQRELDARLASPKRGVEPPRLDTRRPRASNNSPLPRSSPPNTRSLSRGRSPSPTPPNGSRNGHRATPRGSVASSPRKPSPAIPQKTKQTPALRRRKQLPQALLDTSADSFSDIDDRLTALQQFLREAKQGGVGVAGASTAA
ncbi:Coiled-coil domain-containing protein 61 [Phytophthora pseudosyringae]|uniref:Coiled-coil domain-containing protein 61 n=1 Tax=Phytophthora pseudosyringae TaxID=221518 RepID=A0A8T1VDB0_9STRA|nr:Coiled-coil domain-containing protein 61 [Phytophthora pseudosyringae]